MNKKSDSDYENISVAIGAAFPGFVVDSVEKIGEGMESIAYTVNEKLIFRFPKTDFARESLKNEIYALPKIRGRFEIEIPDFKFIEPDANFVGYPKIDGEDLTTEIFESLSTNEQEEIQRQLAGFLVEIHQTEIIDFPENGIEIQDFRADYAKDLNEFEPSIFPLIEKSERDFIRQKFDDYLSDKSNFSYTTVLLHNDLSADHLMFDRQTKRMKGIIDFGDIAIGDADYDLMYLLKDYGENFVRSFLRFYPHPDHRRLFDKMYFWSLADNLQMILYYRNEGNKRKTENLIHEMRTRIHELQNRDANDI